MSKHDYSFKVGDMVIVHKPDDIYEHPRWIEEMDKYDGLKTIVTRVDGDCLGVEKARGYYFSKNWLELIIEEDEEMIEASDISLLL